MKNINVVNYKGTQYSGEWNGKAYSSKIDDHDELHRIYIDNNPVHITDGELKKLQADDADRQERIAKNRVNDFFDWLEEQPDEVKKQMFLQALEMMAENSKRSKTCDAIGTLRGYFHSV